ncbi:MAG: hypothetical protein H7A25_05615 [Leptospiraceae bacterium]|nr:hypothetical protein [Leptospiraceae bacterium]MCP5499358.1 hypothetical protein [Leptospiraceae bacterium]
MERSQEERHRLKESDFAILEKKTEELIQLLKANLILQEKDTSSWPKRYLWKHKDFSYECIFSGMASLSLRPEPKLEGKKNPAPIFYMSLGKYGEGVFYWEGPDKERIEINTEFLLKLEERVSYFENLEEGV